MDKEILNKVRVIDCKKKTFEFPEEGWFVGASNGNWGDDHFMCDYLYEPKWSKHGSKTWGGYTTKKDNGKLDWWWTFGDTYGTINNDFLYYCEDKETAKELANFLNLMPSRNYKKLKSDIKDMRKQIEELQCQIDKLEGSFELIDEMLKKIE